MSDRHDSRVTEDDALGRQIKTNLRGLDTFVLAAPPFAEIQPPAPRVSETRSRSTVRLRQNPRAASGLLVAGMLVAVVLGSVVWRPDHSAGAVDSPTASDIASGESGTPEPSAISTTGVSEPSPEASAAPTIAPEPGASVMPSSGDGVATAASPWYAAEVNMLKLINCTRTGGWVSTDGSCGLDQGQHTLPAQPALVLDPEISAKVARPYARYLAERRILAHDAVHDPSWRLCNWGGLCGGSWAENLASPGTADTDGMIAIEIFYQNEAFILGVSESVGPGGSKSFGPGWHYGNIMDPSFHRVGIGVWETSGIVRVVIEFYE